MIKGLKYKQIVKMCLNWDAFPSGFVHAFVFDDSPLNLSYLKKIDPFNVEKLMEEEFYLLVFVLDTLRLHHSTWHLWHCHLTPQLNVASSPFEKWCCV